MNPPLHAACALLNADPRGLLAVDKAAGVLAHPNSRRDREQALLGLPYDPGQEAFVDGERRWFLLNRLDGPTSGVILLADNPAVAEAVRAAFAAHAVHKTYAAVVKGIPRRPRETWRDHLTVRRGGGKLRTEAGRGAANAETVMELLQRGAGPPARALLTLRPATGRTHQLRVQCASRHLPIIGDATYGDFAFNRAFQRRGGDPRLLLHSWKTRLEVMVGGAPLAFSAESPLPPAFAVALR
jgi:23S rRNA-/tRNA-specific pseudouridylate synthase